MSQTFLNIIELPNGNLEITTTPEGLEYLEDRIAATQDERGYEWQCLPAAMWSDLIESWATNGSYAMVHPGDLGWLTEAPAIIYSKDIDDHGKLIVYPDSKTWYYNNYQTTDELYLLHSGQPVIFTKA